MILQLIHASYTGYYLKEIFGDTKRTFSKKIFINYLILMGMFSIIIILLVPTYSSLIELNIKSDFVFFSLYFYIFFWCLAAYFEQYINKFNNNISILYNNLISIILYFLILFSFNETSLISLSITMMVSSMIYLILTLFRINKLGIKIE